MTRAMPEGAIAEVASPDLELALLELSRLSADEHLAEPLSRVLELCRKTLGLARVALWTGVPREPAPVCRACHPPDLPPLRPDDVSSGAIEALPVTPDGAFPVAATLVVEPAGGRALGRVDRTLLTATVMAVGRLLEREARAHSEVAAAAAERRLRQVEELAQLGSWIWDVPAGRVTWSANLCKLAGVDEEVSDLDHRRFLDFIHPEDRKQVSTTIEGALRGERPYEFQARFVRADGSEGWMLARAQIERDPDGRVVRVIGTAQDTTELRKTQEALRSSETRFRGLFDQFPFSVQIFDPSGRTIQVNPAFEKFWGYGIEALGEFNPLTDPQLEPLRDSVRRGFSGETVYLPPVLFDASQVAQRPEAPGARWIQAFMFPVRDSVGRVREVILVHQDVTQQRQAEEQLRISEESYRTIFDLASDAIFVHDPVTGSVLDVNRKACEIHGYSHEELRSLGLQAITGSRDEFTHARAVEFIRRAAAGEPQLFEWLSLDSQGNPVWVEVALNGVSILGEDRVLANVRNIHARKTAEEALRHANEALEQRVNERTAEFQAANLELTQRTEELEGIFLALPDLYFRMKADGTILHHRSGGGQALYLEPSLFLGRRITDVMPPDVSALIAEGLEEVARTGSLAVVEYPLTMNGVTEEFEARILPLPDGDLISIVRDITARKRAERALQDREEHFRKLIENAHDMVVILDRAGRTLYGSPSVQRILGYDPEGLREKDSLEFVHPDDAARVLEDLGRLAYGESQTARIECRFRHKDGSWRYLEAVGNPLAPDDPEGAFVFNVRDVTDRHAAQNALREREEHFRRLIENAHDITCIWDEEGTALYQSPSLQRRLGYSPEALIGKSSFPYIHPDDVPALRAGLQAIAAKPGTVNRLEYRFKHQDGSWRMLEAFGRTLLPSSASGGIVLNIRDVTERMLAERALEQAMLDAERAREAAERANRAKSEFLSRMSHELRTPMNSILGFAQLLDRADIPTDQKRGVQHILKAGRHLLHLINEVLEIAKIESGRQNFSLEPVRLRGVLQEAVGLVRPLAAQRSVELDEGPWAHDDTFVRADRQRLVQVLLNLLSNAVKYNRAGGSVRLSCIPASEGSHRLVVLVRDTGVGIPEERRDELFTPFSRLGAEQTDVEGTGLGLALSQRLAEAMGGILELESTSPEGSVFRLELVPAHDPASSVEEGSASAAKVASEHRPATLLYVEDNLANLSLVETILLTRPKWRTLPALQGQLGLELAREHRPDLILLDLHLPDMHGDEVLRRLRLDPRTRDIPIVVISADATRDSQARLAAAGVDGYLTKPLDIDEFLETLDRFLSPRE